MSTGLPAKTPELVESFTIRRFDRGPEPEWHKDRTLYAPWMPAELIVDGPAGPEIARVRGLTERDAWNRLAGCLFDSAGARSKNDHPRQDAAGNKRRVLGLDQAHTTRALQEALHALEVIEGFGGTAGSVAAAGISRAWAEL